MAQSRANPDGRLRPSRLRKIQHCRQAERKVCFQKQLIIYKQQVTILADLHHKFKFKNIRPQLPTRYNVPVISIAPIIEIFLAGDPEDEEVAAAKEIMAEVALPFVISKLSKRKRV